MGMSRDQIVAYIQGGLIAQYQERVRVIGYYLSHPESFRDRAAQVEEVAVEVLEAEKVRQSVTADHAELAKSIEEMMERLQQETKVSHE